MNKRVITSLFATCLWVASASDEAWAADAPAYPLTYASAIQAALANRSELAVERASVQRATARVEESKGAFSPSLDAFSTIQHIKTYKDFSGLNADAEFNGMDIPISVSSFTPPYQMSAGLELSYNLYSGGLNQARLSEAISLKENAESQREITRKRIVLDATAAYWNLRKAQMRYHAEQQNLEHAKEELDIANAQFKLGRIAQIDLDTNTLELQTREFDAQSALRNLLEYQQKYYNALGLEYSLTPDAMLPPLADQADTVEVERVLSDSDISFKAEAVLAESDMQAALERANQIRSEFKPTVDLFVRHTGIGRGSNSFGGASSDFGRDVTTIGVRFKWNLFDGGQKNQRLIQANAVSEQMRLRSEQTRRDLIAKRQEKLFHEADVNNQLALSKKQLAIAQSQLKIAAVRLDKKLISTAEYRLAQQAVEQAAEKVASLKVDLIIARAESILTKFSEH